MPFSGEGGGRVIVAKIRHLGSSRIQEKTLLKLAEVRVDDDCAFVVELCRGPACAEKKLTYEYLWRATVASCHVTPRHAASQCRLTFSVLSSHQPVGEVMSLPTVWASHVASCCGGARTGETSLFLSLYQDNSYIRLRCTSTGTRSTSG